MKRSRLQCGTTPRREAQEQAEAEIPPVGAIQHCLFNSCTRKATHCSVFMEILAVTIIMMRMMTSLTLLRCRQPQAPPPAAKAETQFGRKGCSGEGTPRFLLAFYNYNQI